jgi:hypothetical protein
MKTNLIYMYLYYVKQLLCFLLQDEYHTTTKNYEGQLSMMSEHLAGLNEKLTQQKDEIDELRVQATSKVINVEIDELRVQATSKVINVEIDEVKEGYLTE